jgi:hypothetical protein
MTLSSIGPVSIPLPCTHHGHAAFGVARLHGAIGAAPRQRGSSEHGY